MARLLGVSAATVHRRIRAGDLRAYWFGPRSCRVRAEELERFIAEAQRPQYVAEDSPPDLIPSC